MIKYTFCALLIVFCLRLKIHANHHEFTISSGVLKYLYGDKYKAEDDISSTAKTKPYEITGATKTKPASTISELVAYLEDLGEEETSKNPAGIFRGTHVKINDNETEQFYQNLNVCLKQYPVTEGQQLQFLHDKGASMNTSCLFACVLKKYKMMSDVGKLDIDKFNATVETRFSSSSTYSKNGIRTLVKFCKHVNQILIDNDKEGCFRAMYLYSCMEDWADEHLKKSPNKKQILEDFFKKKFFKDTFSLPSRQLDTVFGH